MKFELSVRRGDFFCARASMIRIRHLLFHFAVERRIGKFRHKREYSRIFMVLETIGQGRDRGRAHQEMLFENPGR